MTDQLDPFDRYQNKKQKFLRKVLRRMFRVVGRTYSVKITGQPDWFLTSTWTIEQATAFQNFFVKTAMKDLHLRKRQALKEAMWFGFFCGWKIREGDGSPATKPKVILCDHRKHICRCKDFQPAPGDDNFCANCICPASYHSAAALRGKSYTRCIGGTK